MIEPTDEMIEAAGRAFFGERPLNPIRRKHLRQTLAAAFAIIERDHVVLCSSTRPPDDSGYGDLRCMRSVGHVDDHVWTYETVTVIWP